MINLQDVFIIQNLSILNEGKSGGPMKIRGIFQRADEANNNQRIYPKRVLESQVRALTEAIKERRLVGELDHPTYDMVKLSNASHLITGLHLEGNEVVGEAEILPTPAGKVVEGLIRGGVKIGISSRGMGTLSEGRNGTKTVNEDFRLVTFDIVADPSTRGAYPTLAESTQLKKINKDKKIIESTIKQVVGERLFLKLLEKKIEEIEEKLAKKGKNKRGGTYGWDIPINEPEEDEPPAIAEVRGDTLARRLSGEGADVPTEKGYEKAERAMGGKKGGEVRKAAFRVARANVQRYSEKK